jgi:benzoyl-CoA reductase subunit A
MSATYLGIDLGSTTTKAVLLDAAGKVAGLGLTNTRSNYDVAAAVARGEAMADAQLSRLEAELTRLQVERPHEVLAELRRAVRLEQSAQRLAQLRRRCVQLVRDAQDGGEAAAEKTDALFGAIADDIEGVFGALATDRSRFFRDMVAARVLTDAEAASRRRELPYEAVIGAYDRAIVEIENAEATESAGALLARALGRARFDRATLQLVERAWTLLEEEPIDVAGMVGTGYGRQRLPFPKDSIRSEILCHGLGAHALFPNTRTVLDIGGQDTKAIQVDGAGVVTGFQMNDRCAAGCGRYLGYIAEEMNLGIHELGPLAMAATRPVKISSTCTVFAGVELRARLSLGEKRENILLGLHRAIILRAMSLLARSGGVHDELTFTGGVAKNPAVVHALRELVAKHYGQRVLNIHTDSIYTGALGAALFAQRGAHA